MKIDFFLLIIILTFFLTFSCRFVSGPVTTTSLAEANQREEETRLEVERLTAEIRTLKLQILQLTGSLFALGYPEEFNILKANIFTHTDPGTR